MKGKISVPQRGARKQLLETEGLELEKMRFFSGADPARPTLFAGKHIVAGNVETRVIGEGSWRDVYEQARACIEKAKYAPGGYVLMAGCDIPPSAPPYNIYALKKAVVDFGFYD